MDPCSLPFHRGPITRGARGSQRGACPPRTARFPDDAAAAQHFETLRTVLKNAGFEHYEFSNYGKPGYFSQNNTAYWLGKPYLGIGPSAHSYDGNSRKWNIANNTLYIKAIERSELPLEVEELSITDRYNEYIMTRLRTYFGVDLVEVESEFGKEYLEYLKEQSVVLFEKEFLRIENNVMHITEKGTFLSDGIAADLFYID